MKFKKLKEVPTLPQHFWDKISYTPGCWLWCGYRNSRGYGIFSYKKEMWKAHRLSFIHYRNLPKLNLYVLHKCNIPNCVNPKHLYAGTLTDNAYDSVKAGTHNCARKTHCKRGHPFSGSNVRKEKTRVGVGRRCKACHNIAAKKSWKKMRRTNS